MAATAAATAAAGRGNILLRRHPSQLDGRTDVLGDLRLETLQLPLSFQELPGDLILEKGVARRFEILDLRLAQLDAGTLLVPEILTFFLNALILEAGSVVSQEPFDLGLVLAERWIRDDLGTEFFGLRDDGGFFEYG